MRNKGKCLKVNGHHSSTEKLKTFKTLERGVNTLSPFISRQVIYIFQSGRLDPFHRLSLPLFSSRQVYVSQGRKGEKGKYSGL